MLDVRIEYGILPENIQQFSHKKTSTKLISTLEFIAIIIIILTNLGRILPLTNT